MSPKIHAEFWTDPDLEDISSDMRLTLLWMITNPQIAKSLTGVFEMSPKRFTLETGLNSTWLEEALRDHAKMFLRLGNKVLVRNFIRHQIGSGPNLPVNNIGKSLLAQIPKLPESFQVEILTLHPELKPFLSPSQALGSASKPLETGGNGELALSSDSESSPSKSEALTKPSEGQRKGEGEGTGERTRKGNGESEGEIETATRRAEPEEVARIQLRWDLAAECLAVLNKKTGANILSNQATLLEIAMRLHEVDLDVAGVNKMIARQVLLWGGDNKTRNWLKPSTLFESVKFHEYYGQRDLPAEIKNGGDPKAERRRLVELIDRSPANRESVYHSKDVTELEKQHLKKLRADLSALDRAMSNERRSE